METIRQRIARLHAAEEAVALRRHLHQYPDLSEQETPTMNLLCEKLDALGIPYEKNVAETGIVALIRGASEGPVIGLRADMDALPMKEESGFPFASTSCANFTYISVFPDPVAPCSSTGLFPDPK